MKDNIYSKYNQNSIVRSKYYYTDCDVLINEFGIKNEDDLIALEEDLTNQRLAEMLVSPIKGHFGITHIKNIHRHIFQDIYPFAGRFRQEDIWKDETFFYKSQFISQGLEELLSKLKSNKFLRMLDINEFSMEAAFYMGELNIIHPFREGNGRAIREFIRCLGLKNGYNINWSLVDSKELLNASIISVNKVYEPLTNCIKNSIDENKLNTYIESNKELTL